MAHLYLSHPQVLIDAAVPVPEWGLSPLGRARTQAFAALPIAARYRRIVASRERKAIETAAIIGDATGVAIEIRDDLHENDRSATGFLPPAEFEAVANLFFAHPFENIRGWERAADAQARIVGAVTAILAEAPDLPTLFVGHGGVGTLLLCHAAGFPIARVHDQKGGGGNCFLFDAPPLRLLAPWRSMEESGATIVEARDAPPANSPSVRD